MMAVGVKERGIRLDGTCEILATIVISLQEAVTPL